MTSENVCGRYFLYNDMGLRLYSRLMKRTIIIISLALAACGGDKGDVVSSRSPHPQSNPSATVVILEFADFQCPACRVAHEKIVKPLLQAHGADIRYEFRHFPLRSIHRYALDAAEVAECAADQEKFWEFVDHAYVHQDDLNNDGLLTWAKELDLDVDLLETCWKSRSKKSLVLAEYEEGGDMGVGGTPTFFVNGERVEAGFDTLSAAIEERLGAMKQRL